MAKGGERFSQGEYIRCIDARITDSDFAVHSDLLASHLASPETHSSKPAVVDSLRERLPRCIKP